MGCTLSKPDDKTPPDWSLYLFRQATERHVPNTFDETKMSRLDQEYRQGDITHDRCISSGHGFKGRTTRQLKELDQ